MSEAVDQSQRGATSVLIDRGTDAVELGGIGAA
jgi:hypothetical protein